MPPLYISEQGTKIRIRNNCIHVEREDAARTETIYHAPIGTVSQVVLSGNVGLTTPAIAALLDRKIDVVFLDSHGHFRGRLQTESDPHVWIRRGQYRAVENKDFCQNMVRCLVSAKIRNQKYLLMRSSSQLPSQIQEMAIKKIDDAELTLKTKSTVNAMRGVEGKAAAAYFSGYRQLFNSSWNFHKRIKNPSPDPVNAMLSYGYTLLSQLAVSALQTVGLDPYAGFLHEEAYNRPSLGLDLMEEFRPIIDEIVLNFCVCGEISPNDFKIDSDKGGCWMNSGARKMFIQRFENQMESRHVHPVTQNALSLRQCILEQARQIAFCCEKAPSISEYKAMEFA